MTNLDRRTTAERAERGSDAEVMRLKMRLRELGAALRNRQEVFNGMLEQLQTREEEAVQLAGERAARAVAEASARRLRFLAEASAILASSLDLEKTLSSVVRLAVPFLADVSAVDLLQPDGTLHRIAVEHRNQAKSRLMHILQERFPSRVGAPAGPGKVVHTRRPDVALEVGQGFYADLARSGEHLALLRDLDPRSYIAVPLLAGDEVLGALTVVYTESDRRYTADDVALIEDLGHRAATAIQNARLVRGLEEAQTRLQEQAQELEAQTEELQDTAEELELNSEALRKANVDLAAKTREAERARDAAQAANSAKSEFLAMMSHELRTPLNAIAGYGELLALGIHGELTEAQAKAIDRIRRAQRRLLSMINDVLNFARLEAGRVEVSIEDVRIGETFADLEATIDPQMALKGLTYRFERCEPELVVRADREKMEQVLLNLLSNAVKFTDSGGSIRMFCEADGATVRIHVADTGRGIPPEKLDTIFEPFVQVNPKLTGETEGIGLGLAISRDLARAMGGELSVESRAGKGSTFTLRLKQVAAAQ